MTPVASRVSGRAPSSIAALDIVMLEITTDSGLTGWGDAFSYVCPHTTFAAVNEMIAPQGARAGGA
jgi:L-alanine-DL-glutamate epimerase-like enolase superfamily enzyme